MNVEIQINTDAQSESEYVERQIMLHIRAYVVKSKTLTSGTLTSNIYYETVSPCLSYFLQMFLSIQTRTRTLTSHSHLVETLNLLQTVPSLLNSIQCPPWGPCYNNNHHPWFLRIISSIVWEQSVCMCIHSHVSGYIVWVCVHFNVSCRSG